ncbi:type I restriction enzyme S subunit [Acidovorax sp. 69]|uniref:restriction endonuclease subunit S n=1 Tax=Acidovorax sp. 69 TaxID=2035202 RepID=UPI000C24872D|nr:restriction endonuclease subunit S [Acidovorax sp. 69]PJI97658.1 type I restriction enzyme S subunit [Acidovorax sp. 69]
MSNKNKALLVPKLRFPEFRGAEGWSRKRLKDACEVNPSSSALPAMFVYIDLESVEAGKLTARKVIAIDDAPSRAQRLLHPDDVIFQIVRPYQRNNFHFKASDGLEYVASTGYAQLRAKDSADFLYQAVHVDGFVDRVIAKCTGSSYPAINSSDLAEVPLALSKPDEQKKIADCLRSLDELIAAQARKVDALKTHKKGLMQQLFPREGETQPRLRFPEFRDSGKWKKMTLGSAANFYNGRAYKQEELLEAGKYKVLRVGNFFTNNNWYHSNLELDETKYCEDGDLLYAWSASFGPRVWRGEKTIYHYHIWKVVEQPSIDKQFLFIVLEHETERMKAKTTNGLGIMHITKGAIESWESAFPDVAEQRKIAERLVNLDISISSEARKLEFLAEHKKGLMQQLFPSIDDIEV